MKTNDKILAIIIFLSVITFYFYASHTISKPESVWVMLIFIPLLTGILYYIYIMIKENSLYNAGGNLNFLNYYGLEPVYLQIIEDGKFFAWDDYVDENSITQYEWAGVHQLQVVASDDPNIGNPATTIYFDKTYDVTGKTTILIVLNNDATVFEQVNDLC